MAKNNNSNSVAKNTTMLYIMNITKIVLPLVTLPYLTRVLSKTGYGTVNYVKAVMQYVQMTVDFGFLLSATKDVILVKDDKDALCRVVGDTLLAKLILLAASFVVVAGLTTLIPLLRANPLFTFLSFVVVGLTCFLMDFLFRGLEEMQVITMRYVVMRLIAAALTFVFVKSDADILWIPVLDILGSLVAIVLVFWEMKKRAISIKFTGLKSALKKLHDSAIFFVSNMATTTFTALNTILIGIFIDTQHVAEWTLCMQMVSAVQAMYTPVTDGIYPYMVKSRDWKLIRKATMIFMPIIFAGCVFTFFAARLALVILGGEKYASAVPLLRAFIPLLFFSFPAMLYGWPALGSIGKSKETTRTTVTTAGIQIAGLVILLLLNQFTVINLAILRGTTELFMLAMRYGYCRKFMSEFANT